MSDSDDMIVVSKGVAVPRRTRKGGSRYPWATMEESDSFFVECGDRTMESVQTGLYVSARRHGVRVATRRGVAQEMGFKEMGEKVGVGCWRVS